MATHMRTLLRQGVVSGASRNQSNATLQQTSQTSYPSQTSHPSHTSYPSRVPDQSTLTDDTAQRATKRRTKPEVHKTDVIPHRHSYARAQCDERRQWVEAVTGARLPYVAKWWGKQGFDLQTLKGNIEMPIGTITVPLGIAGPVLMRGEHAQGHFLLPCATTEGALVASINRGAAALTQSGGVYACAGQQRITRCPAFKARDPIQASRFGAWLKSKMADMQEHVVSKHSRHAKLTDIFNVYDAEVCHSMLVYETGDAAGQNASTVCTWHALLWLRDQIPEEFGVTKTFLDLNLSGDKKGNNFNAVIGRGTSVIARATIPESVLENVLKINSADFVYYWKMINRMGERTNQGGGNGNVSNVIAAVFAATGQDIACVHESSFAQTNVEMNIQHGGVDVSTFLPSLIIGTVGGGTGLPTQGECLEIMGCHGAGKAKKFAEIIATYCLALDLSTTASMASGSFALAHDALGRNRPQDNR